MATNFLSQTINNDLIKYLHLLHDGKYSRLLDFIYMEPGVACTAKGRIKKSAICRELDISAKELGLLLDELTLEIEIQSE